MNRLKEWREFSKLVEEHIKNYANMQYENKSGNEQIDDFTTEDCWQCIQRYYNRRLYNARGLVESRRDMLKVAHYAQFVYNKLTKEEVSSGEAQ